MAAQAQQLLVDLKESLKVQDKYRRADTGRFEHDMRHEKKDMHELLCHPTADRVSLKMIRASCAKYAFA